MAKHKIYLKVEECALFKRLKANYPAAGSAKLTLACLQRQKSAIDHNLP